MGTLDFPARQRRLVCVLAQGARRSSSGEGSAIPTLARIEEASTGRRREEGSPWCRGADWQRLGRRSVLLIGVIGRIRRLCLTVGIGRIGLNTLDRCDSRSNQYDFGLLVPHLNHLPSS